MLVTQGHLPIAQRRQPAGTVPTRALESDADPCGARPGDGWTELIITPDRGLHLVYGIISGWHPMVP